ncbi:ATP-binding protein [Paenibacillus sp. QZ-Y1]|uniref:ATP-binding protein n=1 Tax=Paenibacillus sp. QZ-Y1 TaxID=3414511 RepID=UPI003F79BC88
MGDRHKVSQILINLIGNALKFTEKGGVRIHTQIHTESEGTVNVSFAISDTGIGIPPDHKDRLFKSFSQIHGNTEKFGGTGLGLSICKQFTELMGGSIWLDNSSHKGSRFVFNISSPAHHG